MAHVFFDFSLDLCISVVRIECSWVFSNCGQQDSPYFEVLSQDIHHVYEKLDIFYANTL